MRCAGPGPANSAPRPNAAALPFGPKGIDCRDPQPSRQQARASSVAPDPARPCSTWFGLDCRGPCGAIITATRARQGSVTERSCGWAGKPDSGPPKRTPSARSKGLARRLALTLSDQRSGPSPGPAKLSGSGTLARYGSDTQLQRLVRNAPAGDRVTLGRCRQEDDPRHRSRHGYRIVATVW